MTEQEKALEEVEAFKWMTSKGYDRKASKDIAQILVKYKEEQLLLHGVGCSVWMVQDTISLVVHGMFTTQAKAIKYANGSNNMAVTNLSLG